MNFVSPDLLPRERLVKYGVASLSNAELLALILRVGGKNKHVLDLSTKILNQFGSLSSLRGATLQQLLSVKNLGFAKACALIAAGELSLRLYCDIEPQKIKIKTPSDVYDIVKRDFIGIKKEMLFLVCLDARNKFISKDLLSVGSVNETLVSPREIFLQTLRREAVSFVLCHNHPSNEPTPSAEDIILTEKIASVGENLGVIMLDHLIVCDSTFVSMKSLNIFETFTYKRKEVKK